MKKFVPPNIYSQPPQQVLVQSKTQNISSLIELLPKLGIDKLFHTSSNLAKQENMVAPTIKKTTNLRTANALEQNRITTQALYNKKSG